MIAKGDIAMKLTYHRCGDYLLPDLGLTEEEQQPLGKYGIMRMNYLKEHRPISSLYINAVINTLILPTFH